MTLEETKSIVALSLVRFKSIGPESIKMAIREKRQIVRRSGILDYEEPQMAFRGLARAANGVVPFLHLDL